MQNLIRQEKKRTRIQRAPDVSKKQPVNPILKVTLVHFRVKDTCKTSFHKINAEGRVTLKKQTKPNQTTKNKMKQNKKQQKHSIPLVVL